MSTTNQRPETLGQDPAPAPEHLRSEVTYLIQQGWSPVVEHGFPESAGASLWYLWRLPHAGEHDVEAVLAELSACHRAYPHHDVRLVGYDNARKAQGTAMTVYRAA